MTPATTLIFILAAICPSTVLFIVHRQLRESRSKVEDD
jgi:hypothetical protein